MAIKEYHSPFPDVELKNTDLVTYLFSNPLNTSPSKPMYIDATTGRTHTYADVQRRAKSLSNGLRSGFGVKIGDVICLISPNSIDYAPTCYAIIGSGATVSPANAASTPGELRSQLQTSEARYLIAHSSLMDVAKEAAQDTAIEQIIQADGMNFDGSGLPTAEYLASTCSPMPLVETPAAEVDTRLSFLCFSSGTTGRSKGVMTTHKNLTSNIQQWLRHIPSDWDGTQVGTAFLPFSHIYGLNYYMGMSMISGSTVVVLSRFDLELYLSTVQRYGSEILVMVPPVALALAKDPEFKEHNLKHVRKIVSAAAPLSTELASAVEKRFADTFGAQVHCFQAWGLTETSPLATMTPQERPDKRDSVGCITPNMVLRCVDPETLDDIREVDERGTTRPGEIWCRGPNVTKGYYRNEEASRDGFAVDERGRRWFRTGDIATIDAEGYVTIVDRIKEMIKYKGLQVIPSELEGKLLLNPLVGDACVVGHWVDELATELPVGFVVLSAAARKRGDERGVIKEVNDWLNERVANHKRLRGGIRIVNAIPKNASGKILRRQFKELLKAEVAGKEEAAVKAKL